MSLDRVHAPQHEVPPPSPNELVEKEVEQNFTNTTSLTKALIPYLLQFNRRRFHHLEKTMPELKQDSAYFYIKGKCLSEKHATKAIRAYHESLQLHRNNIVVHHKLAEIYRSCFKIKKAKYHINKAVILSETRTGFPEMKESLKKLQTEIGEQALAFSMLNIERLERN